MTHARTYNHPVSECILRLASGFLMLLTLSLACSPLLAQPPEQPVDTAVAESTSASDADQAPDLPSSDDLRLISSVLKQLDEQLVIADAKLQSPSIERKRQIGRRQAQLAVLDRDLEQLAGRLTRLQQRREDFARHAELLDAAESRNLMQQMEAPIAGMERQMQKLAIRRGELQQELTREQKLHTLSLLQAAIQSEANEALELLNPPAERSTK
ncbi:MAG: hypothetical protein J5I93_02655 [Pirellulaceae bacterium]|nr:hypothetical protein [Pirellulaceae bacterium]